MMSAATKTKPAPDTNTATGAVSSGPKAAPGTKTSPEQSAIVRLLRVEGEARATKSIDELSALIANEALLLLRARQCFVTVPGVTGRLEIVAGSSLGKIDRNAPLIQSLEMELAKLALGQGFRQISALTLWSDQKSQGGAGTGATRNEPSYPFRDALWVPLMGRDDKPLAGILIIRDDPWQKSDVVLAERLSMTFAQTWHWLSSTRSVRSRLRFTRKKAAIAVLAMAIISVIPVSLTALAPMEIVARSPFMVTAPMDGIIEGIPVAPSSRVEKGDVLVRFASTALKNRLEVADREVEVAMTRVKKTMLAAVSDIRARHDLALAQAELTVKIAERDFAADMLGRSVVIAERSGLAVFGDKRDYIGKPVATGERIMEIADPQEVDIRISLPVGDAIVLGRDNQAKVFLDSAPLAPKAAIVIASDYYAKTQDGGALAFRVTARFADQSAAPRLGLRGTAQLYGGRVPLIYYLLRRPIAAVRQWIGL